MKRIAEEILADMEVKKDDGRGYKYYGVGLPKDEILTLLEFASNPDNQSYDEKIKERLQWCISRSFSPSNRRNYEMSIEMVLTEFFDRICKHNRVLLLQESSVMLFYGFCSLRNTDTGSMEDPFFTEETWQLEDYKNI